MGGRGGRGFYYLKKNDLGKQRRRMSPSTPGSTGSTGVGGAGAEKLH